jgi:hypothetical protein
MGKRLGKRPLGGPRRRSKENIKVDIREVEWRVNGTDSDQYSVAGVGISSSETSGSAS